LTICLDTPARAAAWLGERVRGSLRTDSRQVAPGDGFIAWPGPAIDGRRFVAGALAAGANACLVEEQGASVFGFDDNRIASYSGLKAASGPIAAEYFASPSKQLDVIAVTGTNGKTSTTWMLAQALTRLGRRCAIVGTLGIGVPGAMVANGLTTPDPVLLHGQLRRYADDGFSACAIEASSIGLAERRLDALAIKVAMLTNFTQDHLDFHASMQEYWQAKRQLFDWSGLEAAVINIDDPKGCELAAELESAAMAIWTVSLQGDARLSAQNLRYGRLGLAFDIVERSGETHALQTRLIGEYNVANLLGAVAALRSLGVPLVDAVGACVDLLPVPGRMELIAPENAPLVVIDYAHTPDALEKVLMALGPLADSRKGRLWCVFGCGGNRDASKRPSMAAIAEKYADQIVVTSDNPRGETPMSIIHEVLSGLSRSDVAKVEPDRAAAIRWSVDQAGLRDVVLLAGKGHEDYQDIGGRKLPFSDHSHARAAISARTVASHQSGIAR
jgi:UDP-N-acetylmuramyl-tripeptide synthetase